MFSQEWLFGGTFESSWATARFSTATIQQNPIPTIDTADGRALHLQKASNSQAPSKKGTPKVACFDIVWKQETRICATHVTDYCLAALVLKLGTFN